MEMFVLEHEYMLGEVEVDKPTLQSGIAVLKRD